VTAVLSTLAGTLPPSRSCAGRFRGRDAVNAFVTSPLLLPQISPAVAMLQFFTLVPPAPVVLGAPDRPLVVTTPYVVRTVTATLTHFDLALEEAAQSLGAHPVRAFLEVTLGRDQARRGGGAIFAFAISFDNFTLSLFLTSSRLTPLPIELLRTQSTRSIRRPRPCRGGHRRRAGGGARIARVVGLEEFTGF